MVGRLEKYNIFWQAFGNRKKICPIFPNLPDPLLNIPGSKKISKVVDIFLFEDRENEVINWKILLPLCSNVVSLLPLPTAQIVPCRFTGATLSATLSAPFTFLTALSERWNLWLRDRTCSHFISNLPLQCCSWGWQNKNYGISQKLKVILMIF